LLFILTLTLQAALAQPLVILRDERLIGMPLGRPEKHSQEYRNILHFIYSLMEEVSLNDISVEPPPAIIMPEQL
jgi:hypothetical protein